MSTQDSPWLRGEVSFFTTFDAGLTFVREQRPGWVSRCEQFGLWRSTAKDGYVLVHIPTGRWMMKFPNHEHASAFIAQLSGTCDVSGTYYEDPTDVLADVKGVNIEELRILSGWAEGCLGASEFSKNLNPQNHASATS